MGAYYLLGRHCSCHAILDEVERLDKDEASDPGTCSKGLVSIAGGTNPSLNFSIQYSTPTHVSLPRFRNTNSIKALIVPCFSGDKYLKFLASA